MTNKQSKTKYPKKLVIMLVLWLMLGHPLSVLAQEAVPSPTSSPTLTPTPTLTLREQLKLETDSVVQDYYDKYGITPRPSQGTTQAAEEPSDAVLSEGDATSEQDPTNEVGIGVMDDTEPAGAEFSDSDLSGAQDEFNSVSKSSAPNSDQNLQDLDTAVSPDPLEEIGSTGVSEGVGYPQSQAQSGNVDDPVATNNTTGSNSYNDTQAQKSTSSVVKNTNNTQQQDDFYESADTGFNAVSSVIGDVTLSSGDAEVTFAETSQWNTNVGWSGGGFGQGQLSSAENSDTGGDSINLADASSDDLVEIENTNILDVDQNGQVDVNTGYNLSESIIGDNKIKSGEANVAVNIFNTGNLNLSQETNLQIQNYDIYDVQTEDLAIDFTDQEGANADLQGEIAFQDSDQSVSDTVTAENKNTQSGSVNQAESDQELEKSVKNTNQADLDQDLEINVNTGGNVADGNTGNTEIQSGDINIAVNVVNFLNANLTNVTDFLIGSVNIFGEMLGDIILPDLANSSVKNQGANGGFNSEVQAGNENTGGETTNISQASSQSTTQVNNSNNLEIENEIQMNLDTGANDINSINGGVELKTGEIDSSVNTTTVGNVNSTNGDGEVFWLIVVNNIGEWAGNILGFEGENYAVVDGYSLMTQEDVSMQSQNTNTLGDTNEAKTNLENKTTVENKNDADVDTELTINATTGGNLVNSNNGPARIETGDIKANANLINFANFNFTGKKVMVAVVNVFGKFLGDILPPGWVGEQEGEILTQSDPEIALGDNQDQGKEVRSEQGDNEVAPSGPENPSVSQQETQNGSKVESSGLGLNQGTQLQSDGISDSETQEDTAQSYPEREVDEQNVAHLPQIVGQDVDAVTDALILEPLVQETFQQDDSVLAAQENFDPEEDNELWQTESDEEVREPLDAQIVKSVYASANDPVEEPDEKDGLWWKIGAVFVFTPLFWVVRRFI